MEGRKVSTIVEILLYYLTDSVGYDTGIIYNSRNSFILLNDAMQSDSRDDLQ